MAFNFGWVPNPSETEKFAAAIPASTYQAVDQLRFNIREGQDVKLWLPLVKMLGKTPGEHRLQARNQGSKGSCVGVSEAGLQDLLATADIIERGESEEFRTLHSGIAAYIAGRQVAGILGGGDGSYGSAMAKAVQQIGTLVRGTYGQTDLRKYSIEVIEQLDKRGRGLTSDMLEIARQHPIESAVQVRTLEQLDALLYQFFPTNICSNFGSEDRQRNADGCLRWNGSWPHSMHVCGLIWKAGKKIYVTRNSWGSGWMANGPLVCPDMPMGSFGVYAEDMARILKQGDSFGRAGYKGFKKRKIDLANVFNF